MTSPSPNKRTASTTPEWRYTKIRTAGRTAQQNVAAGVRPALPPWDRKRSLSVTIKYRGGAECWWEITARGRVWRRPGFLVLDDVLQEILDGTGGKPLNRDLRVRGGDDAAE